MKRNKENKLFGKDGLLWIPPLVAAVAMYIVVVFPAFINCLGSFLQPNVSICRGAIGGYHDNFFFSTDHTGGFITLFTKWQEIWTALFYGIFVFLIAIPIIGFLNSLLFRLAKIKNHKLARKATFRALRYLFIGFFSILILINLLLKSYYEFHPKMTIFLFLLPGAVLVLNNFLEREINQKLHWLLALTIAVVSTLALIGLEYTLLFVIFWVGAMFS